MKKRIVSVFLTLTTSLLMFAGCGQKTEQENAVEVGTETGEVQQEIPGGTVSLRVWGAEEDAELLNTIIDGFKQEYAGQAEFEITIEPMSETECKDYFLKDLPNAPDVLTFVDDQLSAFVAAGALSPVDNPDEVKAVSNAGAVEASTINEVLYAYPLTADNGYFMYYNKAYFTEEDVKTLDAMLEVAAANGKKVTIDYSSGWYLYTFFGNTGLEVGLNPDGVTNYCTWNDTTGAIKGIDVANAMITIATHPGFEAMYNSDFVSAVQEGRVIAGVSGVWDAKALEEAWGADLAATKLPTYTVAGQQIQLASFSGYKMVGANAYSDNSYWALRLAEYIANEDNQTLRFEMRGQGPANTNAANSPAIQESPAIQAVLEQSEFASLQRIGGRYWDPVSQFGNSMASGNSEELQSQLDKMVDNITALN